MSEKFPINAQQDLPFRDALYRARCGICGEGLEWAASFDADGTSYYASCCGRDYWMRPSTVTVGYDGGATSATPDPGK